MSEHAEVNVTVRHWHVSESFPGCLPEADPDTCLTGEDALDTLAHLLKDWANAADDLEDSDAAVADGISEQYCTCTNRNSGERSAEHRDALAALKDGRGICDHVGNRVFEATPCQERDCLKYCPNAECGTVTPVTDTDPRCWCCGAAYVGWEACGWLA